MSAWKVRCFIFLAKNLPSSDEEGTSDPFIQIRNPDGDVIKTQTVDANCSPIFMKPLEFYLDYDKPRDAPPILLDCFDADQNFLGGEKEPTFLGRAIIHLETYDKDDNRNLATDGEINYCPLPGDDNIIPEPKLHNFYFDTISKEPCGQVLCSFQIVKADFTFSIDIDNMKTIMAQMIER